MSFKKNKYIIIRKAISKDLAQFCYEYLLLKRNTASLFFKEKYISPYEKMFGIWNDTQVFNTWSCYGDIAMETLLLKVLPIMEKNTKLKLIPTYAYTRMYKNGDVLERHKDRNSCEISTTMHLGGEHWPIYLEPNKNVGIPNGKKITRVSNNPGIKINLKPGDMLIYSGCILEHWREPFEGVNCGQVFLHYNRYNEKNLKNEFDGRPMLGLPSEFSKNKP